MSYQNSLIFMSMLQEPPEFDPLFSQTALIFQGGGPDKSTVMIDGSLSNKVPMLLDGSPRNSSSYKRFGKNSPTFNGNGDRVVYAATSDLALQGDFTIDFWINLQKQGAETNKTLINMGGGINIAWSSYQLIMDGVGDVRFTASFNNTGNDLGSETGSSSLLGRYQFGKWAYGRVTREGNLWRGSLNQDPGFSLVSSGRPFLATGRGLQIGSRSDYSFNSVASYTTISGAFRLRITNAVRPSTIPKSNWYTGE